MALFDYNISLTGDCQSNSSGAVELTLTGGTPPYTVNWAIPNLGVDTTYSTSTRTGLTPNTYVVEVNDSTLPENSTFLINIPISSGVCVSILNVSDTTCGFNNGAITGSSTSLFSFSTFGLYSGDGTYLSSTFVDGENFYFDSLGSGIYYVVGEDLGGCSGYSETFIIEDSRSFDFGVYSVPNSTCNNEPNGKIYVTGQTGYAPYTYVWSNNATGNTITGLTEGLYSVQVTDSKGCTKSQSVVVERVEPVGFAFATPTNPTCFSNNGSILFYTTGGTAPFCYSGSNGSFDVSYSREYTLTGLSSGYYSLYVRDAGLCSYTQSVYLASPNNISSVNINAENSYCSNSDGLVTISIEGGSFPYTYYIINPSGDTTSNASSNTLYTFTGLTSGTYTVGVIDASGCTYSDEVIILTNDKFTIDLNTTGTTCGLDNGAIYVYQTSAGTSPYVYYIDGVGFESNDTGYTFTNISSGSHVIDVVDSTGCKQTKNGFVQTSVPLDFSLFPVSCTNGSNGIITAFITNGTPPFTFDWSENVSGNPQHISVSGLTGGSYSLSITDSNGCSLSREVFLDCDLVYTSYQIYPVYDEPFEINFPNKRGMLQLFNEGFNDLTSGNTSCQLISAKFVAEIEIEPSGYTNSFIFYLSNDRTDIPYDNLWYDAVKYLLFNLSAIEDVVINQVNNTMTITTKPSSTELTGQVIEIRLKILYDIICLT